MQIRIIKPPQHTLIIDLPAGSTVQDALNGASIPMNIVITICVNNTYITPKQYASFTLSDGDSIRFMSPVKGN